MVRKHSLLAGVFVSVFEFIDENSVASNSKRKHTLQLSRLLLAFSWLKGLKTFRADANTSDVVWVNMFRSGFFGTSDKTNRRNKLRLIRQAQHHNVSFSLSTDRQLAS